MPFSTRVIPTRVDIAEIHNNNAVQNVLDKASVSNMVGILQQMNTLSAFASEVFSNILEDADKQATRIKTCRERLASIETTVQPVEAGFLHQSPAFFYENPYTGREFTRRDPLRGLLFRRDRSSAEINRRRNQGEPTPVLGALDVYTLDGIPCNKKYSNPEYFWDQWVEAEKAKMEEARRLRKARKEKRAKKKMKRQTTKKIMKVQKKQYNALGAEFTEGTATNEPQFVETRQFQLTDESGKPVMMDARSPQKSPGGKGGSTPVQQSAASPTGGRAPPSAVQAQMQFKEKAATQMSQPGAPPVPAVPNQGGPPPVPSVPGGNPAGGPPPVPPVPPKGPPDFRSGSIMSGGPPPAPGHVGPPPVPGMAMGADHNRQQPSYMPTFSQPMAQPVMQPPPSRPKTAAEMALGSMQQAEETMAAEQLQRQRMEEERAKKAAMLPQRSNALLAGIKSSSAQGLRAVSHIKKEPKPVEGRDLLLAGIKNREKKLHHVDTEKIKHDKKVSVDQTGGIYAILQRRAFVADSSDEESDDSWGSESD